MSSSNSRKRDRWESSSDEEADDIRGKDEHRAAASASLLSSNKNNPKENDNNHSLNPVTNGNVFLNSSSIDKQQQPHETDGAIVTTTTTTTTNESKTTCHNPIRYYNPLLNGCRLVYDSYERLARIDEGTYGVVWKARDMSTDEIVALKQIKFDAAMLKEGFPIAAMREISVLLALSHENIVTVREMVVGNSFDKVFMVMEFMEMDLQEAMKQSSSNPFPQSELKSILHQILSATAHIHSKWYLHRDLKTSNILVHKQKGKIALCDFGLARKYQTPLKKMTQMVITLWYRPPELLFGETVYGPSVDIWSVGCIFGELLTKKPMIQGRGELDQIDKTFKLLGGPTPDRWPTFSSLPNAKTFRWRQNESPQLAQLFPVNSFSGGQSFLDANGFRLLEGLLRLDPSQRLSAAMALDHAYFKEGVEMKMPRFSFDG